MTSTPNTKEEITTPNSQVGHVLPHFVCRLGRFPTSTIEDLRDPNLLQAVQNIISLKRDFEEQAKVTEDRLYEAVGNAPDAFSRGHLLNLKRDAFNHRQLGPEDYAESNSFISHETAAELKSYRQLWNKLENRRDQLKENYHGCLVTIRRKFQDFLQNAKDIQNGLLLSSPSLFRSQKSYLETSGVSLAGNHKSTERSLLRYVSRSAMKATPFGTFCTVVDGSFSRTPASDKALLSREGGAPADMYSKVRLDKQLFNVLNTRIRARPSIRRRIPTDLNSTLREVGQEFRFMALVDGSEAFQRLPTNPVLQLIRSELSNSVQRSSEELISILQESSKIETSEEDAQKYVDRLLKIGFLRFRLGISDRDARWDEKLCDFLQPIDDEWARSIIQLLNYLRGQLDDYPKCTTSERELRLSAMQDAISDTLDAMEGPMYPKDKVPFYEDASAGFRCTLPEDETQEAREALVTFLRKTLPITWPRTERISIRHFYDEHFEGQESVPFLHFYETYYREHYEQHLKNKYTEEGFSDYDLQNPFNLSSIQALQKARHEIRSLVMNRWAEDPGAQTIDLYSRDFKTINKDTPSISEVPISVSMFTQPYFAKDGTASFVVKRGQYFAGYGKYFSRFSYLFKDDRVTAAIREANVQMTPKHIAEIRGNKHINMNIHPPLAPKDISYPLGDTGESLNPLSISDLQVRPSPTSEYDVQLFHLPTDTPVVPVDLGFLNLQSRPSLYQFLSKFTPVSEQVFPAPGALPPSQRPQVSSNTNESSDKTESETPHISRRPRIRFNEILTLYRTRWKIPDALFPEYEEKEMDFEYFTRVQEWREEHNIPCEVYMRIVPRSGESDSASKLDAQKTRNKQVRNPGYPASKYRKPQYIDFSNPLLVDIFGNAPSSLDHYLVILEERFPGKDSLPNHDDGFYTNELILQVDLFQNTD